ncbi:MAG: dihydropteroate synthase [Flavobacteriaceae bacterium]
MGILNVTSDSFYDGGKYNSVEKALQRTETMIKEGAFFIDIGAASSKPGSELISPEREKEKIIPILEALKLRFPETHFSIDTYNHEVAQACIEAGASIINDISGGILDPKMHQTVAQYSIPYVMMHMQGTPKSMQKKPEYDNIITEILTFFIQQTKTALKAGIQDIIIDPGFGFGKNNTHNYTLFKHLNQFKTLGCPLLVGISRKSMIYKYLNVSPEEALNGTTALNALALDRGAKILRVHDIKEAKECVDLWLALQ